MDAARTMTAVTNNVDLRSGRIVQRRPRSLSRPTSTPRGGHQHRVVVQSCDRPRKRAVPWNAQPACPSCELPGCTLYAPARWMALTFWVCARQGGRRFKASTWAVQFLRDAPRSIRDDARFRTRSSPRVSTPSLGAEGFDASCYRARNDAHGSQRRSPNAGCVADAARRTHHFFRARCQGAAAPR